MVSGLAIFLTFVIAIGAITGVITSALNYSYQQNLQGYAQTMFENILTNTGSPGNWGVTFSNPTSFGLAEVGAATYELDSSKLLRLSSSYPFSLSYSYAQSSLGLTTPPYQFKISFLQPLTAGTTIQRDIPANSLNINVNVNDIRGQPVPLASVSINALLYLNFTTQITNNHGSYVSQSTHFGWIIFTVVDASSNVAFDVASITATAPTNELGTAPFTMNLTAIFGQQNMVSNVPLVVVVGQVALGNIKVPFGFWQATAGINLHVFGSAGISGWTLKDNSVNPAKYYLVVYGPNNSTIWRTAINGTNPSIQVVVSTPGQTAIATIYQATSWSAQNGQAVQVPLLASGAPIQSLFTFNTQKSGDGQTIIYKDILIFVDPLLLLSLSGSSQPLTFGNPQTTGVSATGGTLTVQLQRFVLVEGFSYIAQFWFWR